MEHKSLFDNEIKIIKSNLNKDSRGFFSEIYNKKTFVNLNIKDNFVQDNISFSNVKWTLRGLHFQEPPYGQSKFIRVVRGKILDVVVDLRKNSQTYGKFKVFEITDKNFDCIYIPKYFAHGYCTLVNNTEVNYKVSNYYSKKHEKTILWNDKKLSIPWNIENNKAIISTKDKNGILFKDFKSPY